MIKKTHGFEVRVLIFSPNVENLAINSNLLGVWSILISENGVHMVVNL